MKKFMLTLILISLLTFILIGICATYTSQYPTQDDDHVKATSKHGVAYWPYFATDPALSVTGDNGYNQWTSDSVNTNQRLHIDLGSSKIIRRIYYENAHDFGGSVSQGIENFTFWGSNTEASFLELTYATDTGWTELTVATNVMLEHTGADEADPQYIVVTNSTAYRYYAFKFVDNHGDATYMAIRRIELQTEDGYTPPAEEDNAILFGINF